MKTNLDKLREEIKLLEENRQIIIGYLKDAEKEAELWKNAYHGQREAILKDFRAKIIRKTVMFNNEDIEEFTFKEIKELLKGDEK